MTEEERRFGNYRAYREIGSGAFGEVYEAVSPGLMGFEKRFAIKTIRRRLLEEDPSYMRALVNEARIGGLLHHANIVDVVDFGEQDGEFYLVMEFVQGATLAEVLEVCRINSVLLPRSAVLELGIQICRGLGYAHHFEDEQGRSLNLIHRDLKPSNIIVDRDGTAKIIDFGIAKATTNLTTSTTTEGIIKGTPRYMSPEQIEGEGEFDQTTDLYSLGVILFEMITSQPLYTRASIPALVHQISFESRDRDLDLVERVFPGSRPVLARALQKDPHDRYPDADAMMADLRELAHRCSYDEELPVVMRRILPVVGEARERLKEAKRKLMQGRYVDLLEQQEQEAQREKERALRTLDLNSANWEKFDAALRRSGVDTTQPAKKKHSIDVPLDPESAPAVGDPPRFPVAAEEHSWQPPARTRSRRPVWLMALLFFGGICLIGGLGIAGWALYEQSRGVETVESEDSADEGGDTSPGDTQENNQDRTVRPVRPPSSR